MWGMHLKIFYRIVNIIGVSKNTRLSELRCNIYYVDHLIKVLFRTRLS